MDRLPLKGGRATFWARWLRRIDDTLRQRRLFQDGQKILVAVSGGLDSMVLLQTLSHLSKKHRWKLTVAHFNHQLRGPAAVADERLVRATAGALGWPMTAGRGDVQGVARAEGVSLEMAGRRLRHQFLARAARRLRIPVIALAHHADDQVELFFLRLFRGSGVQGLAGMKWSNPSAADPAMLLARPLLNESKDTLAAVAREAGIKYSEDATNVSLEIERNRVRHELLPLLRNYTPRLNESVLRLMELAGAEGAVMTGLAEEWLGAPDRNRFDGLPVAVQRRALQLQLRQLGQAGDYELVERLRRSPGKVFALNDEQTILRDAEGVLHLEKLPHFEFDSRERRLRLPGGQGKIAFAGQTIFWKLKARRPAAGWKGMAPGLECFDAAKVGGTICLRHWRAGDRFQPIGTASARKLQDLFVNMKVSRAERHRRIIATTAKNEIFWVQGLRISEGFKLNPATARVLEWRIGRGASS